ncbi:ABC transporter permease [Kroppenstedtia eburnea]|uniref:ABC-2 type transport system permease protein n=1 Tax=Kroppenstedtia eburnea TaxID=714067 RepID=A0A1N7P5C6_9BACL|nr:ABC transporter permease [Kroppenstedtia eburnea]QKI80841.1 ABC transporter permease [Kroppenstedtia eburnea]SIT05758.1 ABC-2 type transport system permease protein [Kroppenstedtia eburnea]
MKAYWRLTWAQLLLFIRNKNTIIWSLILPVLMILALGTFLGKGTDQFQLTLAVADEDDTTASRALVKSLAETGPGFATVNTTRAEGMSRVKQGDAQALVVLKRGLGERLRSAEGGDRGAGDSSALVSLYLDRSNPTVSQVGSTVIGEAVDRLNKEAVNYRPPVGMEVVNIQTRPLGYIDFLVPGILSLMIMSNNLNGVAATIASWRERGILRRMQGTPLKSSTFIAAQITARVLLNGLQAVLLILVAYFVYGVHVYGSWVLLLMFLLLGTLTFMSMGFIIASLTRTPESAGPIAGMISFPMIFVGGIFFPVRDLPGILQPVVKAIPIGYLTDALRAVMNEGATLAQTATPATVLTAWLVVSFTVASLTFRWDVK